MITTTIIPRVVRPQTEEARIAQLVKDRGQTVARISAAWNQVARWTGRSHEEVMHWRSIAKSLQIDLEMIDAALKLWRTPKDERYAEIRAQMHYEDQQPGAVSNGSVDWENT